MKITFETPGKLAALLARKGFPPHLPCGGTGQCRRCAVRLLEGLWRTEGALVRAPATALLCQTELVGPRGVMEFEPDKSTSESILADWVSPSLPDTPEAVIGVDLGTTTLAAAKLCGGKILGRASVFNPQKRWGDNVISRIVAAQEHLDELTICLCDAVRELVNLLGAEDVTRIAVAGNTVMTSFFHGVDPSPIGTAPFQAPQLVFPARGDLFSSISSGRPVELLTVPCIGAYSGGDLTAGIAETQLSAGEMLVDLGTNCEIAFDCGDQMLCAAAAAGPAFEGMGLSSGMRAMRGAIDHYAGPGDFTMCGGDEVKPRGLCGCAYLDFLAVEAKAGRLNRFGRYVPAASEREISDGVFVTEKDIAALLTAKAAVVAGILTLEETCHARAKTIYLAGGFAWHLKLANAIAIGMLPAGRDYKIVGNTSLAGALRLAADPGAMPRMLANLHYPPRETHLNQLTSFERLFLDGLVL